MRAVTWDQAHRKLVEPGFAGLPHARLELSTGDTITGRVKSLAQRTRHGSGWMRWQVTVVDYRGVVHEVDGDLVTRLHVYGESEPVTPRRAARALHALDGPASRPFVYQSPDGRWSVVHQRAPLGMRYDTQADAMRVAEGCVA